MRRAGVCCALLAVVAWDAGRAGGTPPPQPSAATAWATPGPALVPRRDVEPPAGQFIDDVFALSPDGRHLAYVVTDGGAAADVLLVDVDAPAATPRTLVDMFALGGVPTSLAFTEGGALLVIHGEPGGASIADVFTLDGHRGARVGPFDDLVRAQVGGRPVWVTRRRLPGARGQTRSDLAFLDGATFAPIARRSLLLDAKGREAKLGLKLLYLADGFTRLVGLREGDYDRQADVRTPDQLVVYDLVAGRSLSTGPIDDPVELYSQALRRTELGLERGSAPVAVAEDLRGLEGFPGPTARRPVAQAPPFIKYEPKSLRAERDAAGRVLLSLAVDPVNRDAVAARRTDPLVIHFFELDAEGANARLVGWLHSDGRDVAWAAAGRRIALLHKHRGFGRGGTDVELLDLPTPAASR